MSLPPHELSQSSASLTSGGETVRYPANLRWRCVRCTKSCRDVPPHKRNILLTANDTERIGRATRLEAVQFSTPLGNCLPYERKMKKIEGRCLFLERTSCSIYEARPLICRFYPFYLQRSDDGDFQIGFDSACSGIGKGEVRNRGFFRTLLRLAKRELPGQ